MSREEIDMDQGHDVAKKVGKQDPRGSKHDMKRKRGAAEEARAAGSISSNATVKVDSKDGRVKPSQTLHIASSFSLGSPLPSPNKSRSNPFSMSTGTDSAVVNGTADDQSKGPVTPPPKSPTSPHSSRRVVEFRNGDSSDDDPDYSPPVKRKDFGKFTPSPRHSQKVKVLSSTKKLVTKEQLKERARELEEERSKLPIWTGISSRYPYNKHQRANHC